MLSLSKGDEVMFDDCLVTDSLVGCSFGFFVVLFFYNIIILCNIIIIIKNFNIINNNNI